ncbi:alkaline phosphatase [Actinobacteria bacterium YIM 96077]|uniref:Alkaline phosphatase n=1 Tax=Phytoactinopolyspora halophila TaxID=1981511 RepID=A0A329QCE6_9ACTN|nr:alkaline phosphatase D family protein [Phytoactinopolyspora halophila]AYY13921.1 alkaline phosphatase [Actinobacteria bacterium YIM 96077]RAW10050.1 alkaline phosphatase [Phytoactinopolyspora halophila]
MSQQLGRRRFLQLGGATAATVLAPAAGAWAAPAGGRLPDGLFSLGVASGDPLPERVVIWTRLAPEPLALDGSGGMPSRDVPVQWEVAHDERFSRVVRRGVTRATPHDAHSVHIDVPGLDPARWYFYRFRVQREISPVGRMRTAPGHGQMPNVWRFAIASCQNYPAGYYTSYQNMLDEDLDIVFHLGDYMYEGGAQGSLGRGHVPSEEVRDLAGYRVRLAQYKSDEDLRAMHAAAPFAMTFDDHEMENNWTADDADPDVPPEEFARRKAAAFKAYWEHMPLREAQRPSGSHIQMYRRLHWGDLATINLLDTRQYRSDQVDDPEADSPEAWDPERKMLGDEQMRWLLDELATSSARWNVLAQQVPFFEDADVGLESDKWDGYRVARQRILDELATGRARNPLVLSGDIHANRAANIKADFQDPESATVGGEFTGTSISSGGDTDQSADMDPDPDNPHIRLKGSGRGYVAFRVSARECQGDFRLVDTVEETTSSVRTAASFVMEDGQPGLTPA